MDKIIKINDNILVLIILVLFSIFCPISSALESESNNPNESISESWSLAIPSGFMQIQFPDEMYLEKSYIIEVQIASKFSDNLTEKLESMDSPKTFIIKISPIMEAELFGDNLEIIPFTFSRQVIQSDGYTRWRWEVTPLESGKKTMTLKVYVIIPLHHSEPVLKQEQVFSQDFEINVKRSPTSEMLDSNRIIAEDVVNWVGWDPPTAMENDTNYFINVSIGPENVNFLDRFAKERLITEEINVSAGLSYKVAITGINFSTSLMKGYEEVQRYNPNRPPLWVWQVKPTEKGVQILRLLIWLAVKKENEIYELEKKKETKVVVTVRDKNLNDWTYYIFNLLSINLDKIISLLALILGSGFGWEYWKSRRNKINKKDKK